MLARETPLAGRIELPLLLTRRRIHRVEAAIVAAEVRHAIRYRR